MAFYSPAAQPTVNDLWETPGDTLDMVLRRLDPRVHLLWEPFVGSGASTAHMRKRGFEVANGAPADFFDQTAAPPAPPGKTTVLVSNPPFSQKKQILQHLMRMDTPFALLMPAGTLFTQYFRTCCEARKVQIIVHTKRCRFLDPVTHEQCSGRPSFDIIWCCVDLGLDADLSFA